MPLHIPTLGERVTEADIWAYPTRIITGGAPTEADVWAYPTRKLTNLDDARAALIDKITKAEEDSSGTITADGTEQEILSKTSAEPFMSQFILDVSSMVGTDQIIINETMKVLPAGSLKKFTKTHITGKQEEPILIFAQKYAVRQYKVTLQQLAGTLRSFDWSLIVEE